MNTVDNDASNQLDGIDIHDMQTWFATLKSSGKIPAGQSTDVTVSGTPLVSAVYTFNGAGGGGGGNATSNAWTINLTDTGEITKTFRGDQRGKLIEIDAGHDANYYYNYSELSNGHKGNMPICLPIIRKFANIERLKAGVECDRFRRKNSRQNCERSDSISQMGELAWLG